jgi:hypothetical protein
VLLAGIFAPSEGGAARVADWLVEIHPIIACRALLESEAQPPKATVERVQKALVAAMTRDAPPIARAAAGRIINRLGDPRRGVGLDKDGLPEIDWVLIDDQHVWTYQDDEHPPLTPYHISRYPITNAQFAAFVSATDGYNNPDWWTEAGLAWKADRTAPDEYADADFRLPNHPRIYVTWYEAVAFCAWVSAKSGRTVTLMTEQQYERAARGTIGSEYPWGPDYMADHANIDETGWDEDGTYLTQTTAVGIYPKGASIEGVLDLSGNVWEWCLNEYSSPENTQYEGTKIRVLRGGSWSGSDDAARAASRSSFNPDRRGKGLGFRVVWVSSPI